MIMKDLTQSFFYDRGGSSFNVTLKDLTQYCSFS